MRAKVILLAIVAASAVLAPALYFHFRPASDSATNPTPAQVAVADDAAPPSSGTPAILKRMQGAPRQAISLDKPSEKPRRMSRDEYLAERRSDLAQMGMSNDPADLKAIMSELENSDPAIRRAALNASISFGSADAIPALQNEMNWATDPDEKVEIKKAIDFLQLRHPELTQQDEAAPPLAE